MRARFLRERACELRGPKDAKRAKVEHQQPMPHRDEAKVERMNERLAANSCDHTNKTNETRYHEEFGGANVVPDSREASLYPNTECERN